MTEPVSRVSRETSLFPGTTLDTAYRYRDFLATAGLERGLIGPREAPRIWTRHVLNCAVVTPLLPVSATVCDLGSGAGLPGLVWAIARPDLQVTLVEPLLRRTNFLSEAVADLGLGNVEVVRGRADVLHGVRSFDVVTSRAVAPLDRLLAWSMPLVAPAGALLALKGSSVAAEVDAAAADLARYRCGQPEVLVLGESFTEPTTVLKVAWADPSRVGWPDAFAATSGGSSGGSSGGPSGRGGSRRRASRHDQKGKA